MKKFLFSIALMLTVAFTINAQSAYDVINSHGDQTESVSTKSASLANPWVGAKLAYNLNEDLPLDESFLLSAKVLYVPVAGPRFAIPVVGSVGLNSTDILNPDAGFNVGLFPWYKLSSSGNFTLIAHGGLNYKVITEGVPEGVDAPQQIKVLGGLEAVFSPSGDGAATTLSVTPAYFFNTAGVDESTAALEITGVLPIANGLGLLIESTTPFNNDFKGGFRFGVIVSNKLGN